MNQQPANRELAKRPGPYECNHSCNDKTKCRHLWCVLTTNESSSLHDSDIAAAMGYHILRPRKGFRSLPRILTNQRQRPCNPASCKRFNRLSKNLIVVKENKSLKWLELTHERASAVNDFKLPNGQQRLKIGPRPTVKRKFRPPVDYDIRFTAWIN
jgi:hypothetical protein